MSVLKIFVALAAALCVALAVGQNASIELSTFPVMAVADGRSTITVAATVRDSDGRLVPDGTRVLFNTDRGTFREQVVETRAGTARAVLVAGNEAGFAVISASVINLRAKGTLDFEFVTDRSALSSAQEYIQVDSPSDLRYSMDYKTIEATGPNKSASLTYRDITVDADVLQVTVPSYEVRAKNAVLKLGRTEIPCAELYFRLNQRLGLGITNYKYRTQVVQPFGQGFRLVDGEERDGYGVANIRAGSVQKAPPSTNTNVFELRDMISSATIIAAKRATAFPRKEIQFQKADVYVGGARIMRMPLYKVSVFTNSPVLTDQLLSFDDNQIGVDYPYYFDLTPNRTSLLRLTTGRSGAGRSLGANKGVFLNFETSWSKGDDLLGDASIRGLGRSDWDFVSRQYFRLDPTTDLNIQMDLPAHRSSFAGMSLNKQLPGYNLSASASDSRSFSGNTFRSQQIAMSLEKDPIKIGAKSPFTFTYGLTANALSGANSGLTSSQTAAGLRSVLRMNPVYFGDGTSVTGSFTASKLFGSNAPSGLAYVGSLTLSQATKGGGLSISYDYFADGFSEGLLGQHQLSARGNWSLGHLNLDGFLLQGLDANRQSYQMDVNYRISRDFRLGYGRSYDRFLSDSFLDYHFLFGYRVGYREFGLTWSNRTKRIGFQLLGTVIN